MARASNDNARDTSGIVRLAGAASILLACVIGYFADPLNDPLLSAGVLGMVAGLSFGIRALIQRLRK